MRPNDQWIYTYDYAPGSVWEPWRETILQPEDLDESGHPGWVLDEVEWVASRVRADLPSYLLLADSHFSYNGTWDDTLYALQGLAKRLPLQGLIHLGDLTDGWLPKAKTKEIVAGLLADMEELKLPLFLVPGNHDYNYFRGNPEVYYPEVPRLFVDDSIHSFRMIFIDSFDPKEQLRYGFSEETIQWLDEVLSEMPLTYKAMIFSHVPPLVRLQAWTDNIRNRVELMDVLNHHAKRILAFVNGHNHCDLLFNDLHNGQFPVISINCGKCEYFLEHKPIGAVVPERRLGDRTQESFDIMSVDTVRGEVFFTRFGAGEDRMVRNHKAFWTKGER